MSTTAKVTADLVAEISELLTKNNGIFSIGGSIPISKGPDHAGDSTTQDTTAAPIVLRWDPASAPAGESRNLTFPLAVSSGQGAEHLEALLRDCQPASFGRGGEDVFDEEYRKASKLDASAFSSNLCPYQLGIVDTVAELLMPSAYMAGGSRGVMAELYKLNVYSGPSGHFKPHVDTPRSEKQFGSLVVCLPTQHVGGALVVRHSGQTVQHNWGVDTGPSGADTDPPALHWAAFYSDCEHEVLDVTAGHRVTLTYNLYSVPQRLKAEGKTESMDVARLPLYRAVQRAIEDRLFMSQGGLVGYYCRHTYPHSAKAPTDAPLFPSIFKGVDLSFYKVLRAIGLQIWIRQVLQKGGGRYYDNDDSMEDKENSEIRNDDPMAALTTATRVARYSSGTKHTRVGGSEFDSWKDIRKRFGDACDIVWLNQSLPMTGQAGYVHLTYGNEAGIDTLYTYMAIIFKVPMWKDEDGKE